MRFNNIIQSIALLAFIAFAGLLNKTAAQTFEDARNYAFNGEREKARTICHEILSQGFNSDVALLLGRTYAWDGKYDSARVVFNEVLIHKPENMEVLGAFADVEYWSENYSKAVEYCDMALQKDSVAEDFLLKKAKILNSNEKFEKAVTTLEDFVRKNPGYTEVMKKLKEYRLDLMKNKIKIAYTLDYFDKNFNRDPWQITELSYGRKTKLGSIIARVNYAKRFGSAGFQYEMDAYPKLGENSYGYVNYGFSKKSFFPKNRFGSEWYHNFPKAYEGSIGMRMLFFSSSNVDIYTASIGKYVGNYWISMRSYVTPRSDGTSVSGSLRMRRYFSDPENYYGLKLSYGVSPDDNRNLIDSGERLTLKARALRAEFNHIFNHIWIFNIGTIWGAEELDPGKYSGYYTVDFTFSRLF